MLSKFWSLKENTRKAKDVLDETIQSLTSLSNLLANVSSYHSHFQPVEETQENRFNLGSNG